MARRRVHDEDAVARLRTLCLCKMIILFRSDLGINDILLRPLRTTDLSSHPVSHSCPFSLLFFRPLPHATRAQKSKSEKRNTSIVHRRTPRRTRKKAEKSYSLRRERERRGVLSHDLLVLLLGTLLSISMRSRHESVDLGPHS